MILEELKFLNLHTFWTLEGALWAREKVLLIDGERFEEALPLLPVIDKRSLTICKVFDDNFYPFQCGPLGKPRCNTCEEITYVRNEFWEVECVCERKVCPEPITRPCSKKEMTRYATDDCGCQITVSSQAYSCGAYAVQCGPCEVMRDVEAFYINDNKDCPCTVPECKPIRGCSEEMQLLKLKKSTRPIP